MVNSPLERAVIDIFWDHKRRYGARRIVSELADMGIQVGRTRVRSIMKRNGLEAIQPKSFVPKTTQSDPMLKRSPNLLLESPLPSGKDQIWVGDITYLPTDQGKWLYLATWLDLWSHFIVGWKVYDHMGESLVIDSFNYAVLQRNPAQGLIVHSDGGGQYASKNFRLQLIRKGFRQSMTRRSNHYDNAVAESLFSRFKAELLEGGAFMSLEDAQLECFEYIEAYYNTKRKHSSIGYKKPLQFEKERG